MGGSSETGRGGFDYSLEDILEYEGAKELEEKAKKDSKLSRSFMGTALASFAVDIGLATHYPSYIYLPVAFVPLVLLLSGLTSGYYSILNEENARHKLDFVEKHKAKY